MQSYKEEKCHGVGIIKKKNIIIKGRLDKALGPDEEQKVMGAGSIHWLCLVFIFTKQYAFGGGQQILQLCVSSQNRFKAFSIGLFINYIIRQSFKYLKGMCLGEAGVKLIKSPGWSVLHWDVGRPWFSRGPPHLAKTIYNYQQMFRVHAIRFMTQEDRKWIYSQES